MCKGFGEGGGAIEQTWTKVLVFFFVCFFYIYMYMYVQDKFIHLFFFLFP